MKNSRKVLPTNGAQLIHIPQCIMVFFHIQSGSPSDSLLSTARPLDDVIRNDPKLKSGGLKNNKIMFLVGVFEENPDSYSG